MPSILESLTGALGQGNNLAKLGSMIGGDTDQTKDAVKAAGPAVLAALDRHAASEGGAEPVAELVQSIGPSRHRNVAAFLDVDDTELGSGLVDFLFGSEREELLKGLSAVSPLETDNFATLLPLVAPLVVSVVAERRVEDGLDPAGVAQLLSTESSREAEADTPWLTDAIAAGGALTAVGALVATANARADDVADDGGAAVGGVIETVSEAAGGVTGDVVDTATDGAVSVAELVSGAVGVVSDKIDDLLDGVADDADDVAAHDVGVAGDAGVVMGDVAADDVAVAGDAGVVMGDVAADDVAVAGGVVADDVAGVGVTGGVVATDIEVETGGAAPEAGLSAEPGPISVDSALSAFAGADLDPGPGEVAGVVTAAAVGTETETGAIGTTGAEGDITELATVGAEPTSGDPTPPKVTLLYTSSGGGDDGSRRPAGWHWWAAGGVLMVVFAAWALSTVDGDDVASSDGVTFEADEIVAGPVADTTAEAETVSADDDAAAADDDDAAAADTAETTADADADADADAAEAAADADADAAEAAADADADADAATTDTDAPADAVTSDTDATAKADAEAEATADDDASSEADDDEVVVDVSGVEGVLAGAGFDEVSVEVADGVVTLSGSLASAADTTSAATTVASIEGVTEVVNDIEVSDDADAAGDDGDAQAAPSAGKSLNEALELGPITFRYRSAKLTTGGTANLSEVVTYLNGNDVDVEIQGHTDDDGTDEENLVLGRRRAEAVLSHLVANGIDPGRLSALGVGEAEPKVPNDSLNNKAVNRRIELVVTS